MPKQVREMVTVLSLIMKCAVKANARRDNPAAGHELHVPYRRVRQVPMLTMEQATRLVEHPADHYKPAMWLLIFAGLRPAELCGLAWETPTLSEGLSISDRLGPRYRALTGVLASTWPAR